jgi:hypothetical protein
MAGKFEKNKPNPSSPPVKSMVKPAASPAARENPPRGGAQVRPGPAAPLPRPAAAPQKVMPKTPAPPTARPHVPAPGARPPAANVVGRTPLRPAGAASAVGLAALNGASAAPELAAEVSALTSSLNDLQTRSAFTSASAAINDLTNRLNDLPPLLESARQKGYRYGADLEQRLYAVLSQWETAQPQLVSLMMQQSASLQPQLHQINNLVHQLNGRLGNASLAAPQLRSAQNSVNTLLNQVSNVERSLQDSCSKVDIPANEIKNRLTQVHWAFDQMTQAKFSLAKDECLVMAAAARWDKEGKEDPEGVLYLTDKRILFERKEKVATKKVLFITTASELVHEVLIDQTLSNLQAIQADNKGLFGHQDYIHVTFTAPQLGAAAFHLKGQPAKEWAELVEKARTGRLAGEKAASSGLSASDLVGPLTTAHVLSLQSEINTLQDELMLQSTRAELSSVENSVRSLERKLAGVRARGYVIERDMEANLAVLTAQWDRIKTNSEATLQHQTRLLGEASQSIQRLQSELAGMSGRLDQARPLFMQLKSAVASAHAQAEAASETVLSQYSLYAAEVETFSARLDWIGWMLSALESASFRLLATECGIAAVEAVYEHSHGETENGILFLTDQRLLWEDRVGAFELKVDVPLSAVRDLKTESTPEGCEILAFQFASPAPAPYGRFSLSLPVASDWLKLVGRARSGGYTADRAVPISAEELERVRLAPQQCSQCGAGFTAPLLRGQTEIACEYCGLVTRI